MPIKKRIGLNSSDFEIDKPSDDVIVKAVSAAFGLQEATAAEWLVDLDMYALRNKMSKGLYKEHETNLSVRF